MTDKAGRGDAITVEASQTPPDRSGRGRRIALAGAGLLVVLVVGGVALGVALRQDSFGSRMASAQVMPPDTLAYVSIDLESFDDLDRLLTAFENALIDAGVEPGTSVLDQVDEALRQELGLGIEDVEPWIGRDVGIGVSGLSPELFALEPGADLESFPVDVIVAASVRDAAAADEFLDRFVDIIESTTGADMTESEYAGVPVYVGQPGPDEPELAVARSDDMLMLAVGEGAMASAIDAQSGESLRDNESMRALVDRLHGGRAVTVFLDGDAFGDLLLQTASADPFTGQPGPFGDIEEALEGLGSLAIGAGLTDDGIRIDFVQETSPDAAVGLAGAAQPSRASSFPDLLPADTFVYFGVGEWDIGEAWTTIQEQISAAEPEFDEGIRSFERDVGIDIQRDIVDVLTGEIGLGLVPSVGGALPAATGIDFGIVGGLGILDPEAMAATVERVNEILGGSGVESLSRDFAQGTMWVVEDPEAGGLVSYGVSDDHLLFATSVAGIDELFADGPKLADADRYRQSLDALPSGLEPFLYVDVQLTLDVFEAPPAAKRDLAPLQAVAVGSGSDDEYTTVSLLALIDY